ncbi:MAG: hypothetical protein QM778_23630 [Myxococcales bacterium]
MINAQNGLRGYQWLLLALMWTACSHEESEAPPSPGDDEEQEVHGTVVPLLNGRSVEIDQWYRPVGSPLAEGEMRTRRASLVSLEENTSFVQSLIDVCVEAELRARPAVVNGVAAALPNTTICSDPKTANMIGEPWFFEGSDPHPWPPIVLALNCAAQWSLHIAESTEPTSIASYSQTWGTGLRILLPHGAELPEPYASNRTDTYLKNWDPAKVHLDYRIRPPSASDRASWALLATDLFRSAALYTTTLLADSSASCVAAKQTKFDLDDGTTSTVNAFLAANLADALVSSLEAAEKAQKYIAAAAAARLASAPNPTTALVDAWRGRHDSRLEGIAPFVPVTESLFETAQLVPLYKVSYRDRRAGESEQSFLSTVAESRYYSRNVQGWIYPPTITPVGTANADYLPLYYVLGPGDVPFTLTNPSGSSFTGPFTVVHQVGWIPTSSAVKPSLLTTASIGENPIGTVSYQVFASGDTPFQSVPAKKFPVVTSNKVSRGDQLAEEYLRNFRINPCVSAGAESWCREVLGQVPNRTADDVADDLLTELKASNLGAFERFSTSDTLLTSLNISKADVLRAASRIVQSCESLGRPIALQPATANHAQLVDGTQFSFEAAPPEYLFALTGGRPDYSKPRIDSDQVETLAADARASLPAMLTFFRETTILPAPTASEAEHIKILRRLRGFADEYLGNIAVEVGATPSSSAADQLSSLKVSITGLEFTDLNAMLASCSVWLNENGLACAKKPGSRADCPNHRFNPSVGLSWNYRPNPPQTGKPTSVFNLSPAQAPSRMVGTVASNVLLHGDRIYVSCNIDGQPTVISALTAVRPAGATTESRNLPAMSKAVLDALVRGIAPDPADPAMSALSCAGVPYDVKIPLENELTEAADGADDIESSFAHYLKLARQAADSADLLGDDLVRQGIEMDQRAEDARDKLEDLCGGIINVPSFADAACAGASCNIADYLADQADSAAPSADLSGVSDCLGVGADSKPQWAALGNMPLCVWQYFDLKGTPAPPMVCPSDKPACAHLASGYKHVKVKPAQGTCDGMYPDAPALTGEAAPDSVYTITVDRTLGILVSDVADQGDPRADSFLCSNLLALRTHYATNNSNPLAQWTNIFRLNQSDLKQVAEGLGYREDLFGYPTLMRNGREWRKFGDTVEGAYGAPGDGSTREVDFDWPYAPHPQAVCEIESNHKVGCDPNLVSACASNVALSQKSLLCGGYTPQNLPALRNRLRDAMTALKGVTGATFDNVIVNEPIYSGAFQWLTPSMTYSGLMPQNNPLGADFGSSYYESSDENIVSYRRGSTYLTSNVMPVGAAFYTSTWGSGGSSLDLPSEVQGRGLSALGLNSLTQWSVPTPLWVPSNAPISAQDDWKDSSTATFVGKGDMLAFITGAQPNVRSQVLYHLPDNCPNIPATTQVTKVDRNGQISWMLGMVHSDPRHNAQTGVRYSTIQGNAIRNLVLQDHVQFDVDAIADVFGDGNPDDAVVNKLKPYACDLYRGTELKWPRMMDALELACAAQEEGPVSCSTLLDKDSLPNVEGVEDFSKLARLVQCAADRVQLELNRLYIAGVPGDIIDDLSQGGAVQSFPSHRGEYGATIANLASALINLRFQSDAVVAAVRDMGPILGEASYEADALELNVEIGDVEAHIASLGLQQEKNALDIANIRSRQAMSSSVTQCISALASLGGMKGWLTGEKIGKSVSATAECANSAVQVVSEVQVRALNEANFDTSGAVNDATKERIRLGQQVSQASLNALMQGMLLKFSAQYDKINAAMKEVFATQAAIHGYLADIDAQRNKASREAAKVLLLSNDSLGRQYAVNSSMRARMNTLRVRYERARDNAIRMAYLARRAVEQRLGVDLSVMDQDMTLVEAPNKWADKLCSLSGIDYERIRNAGQASTASSAPDDYNYADGYVGDWVTKLQNFVESYSVDMPFQAGEDIAVVSLSDDIMKASTPTPPQSWNMLYHTDGEQPSSIDADGVAHGWEFTCGEGATALTPPAVASSPFGCSSSVACGSLAAAQSISLASKDVDECETDLGSSPQQPGTPLQPPLTGLELWYRADSCTAVSGQPNMVSECPNRTGASNSSSPTRIAKSYPTAGNPIPLVANGIGGKPTLQTTGMWVPTLPSPSSAFTIAVVARRLDNSSVTFNNSGYAQGALLLRFTTSDVDYRFTTNSPPGVSALSGAAAAGTTSSAGRPQVIIAASGPDGSRLYVDGQLRARTTAPAFPQLLGSYVALPTTGGMVQLADHLSYSRSLSDTEVGQLHAYFADRYGVRYDAPARWLEADDIANARSHQGVSTVSGFPGSTTAIHDRQTGLVYSASGGQPLVDFTPNHKALQFSNGYLSVLATDGASCTSTTATTCNFVPTAFDDFTTTLIGRVDGETGLHQLWYQAMGNATPMLLAVDASTGQLKLTWDSQANQLVSTSAAGVVTPHKPFVVSVHGLKSQSLIQVFVNGALVLDSHQSPVISSFRLIGGLTGQFLNGAIAEYQHHVIPRLESDIKALHEQLLTKYGVEHGPIAGTGAVGGIQAVPGPARMRQIVSVIPGSHWLSWYQPESEPTADVWLDYPDGTSELLDPGVVLTMHPVPLPNQTMPGAIFDSSLAQGWVRYFAPVEVAKEGTLGVGFVASTSAQTLAAMQLELMQSDESAYPRTYFATGAALETEGSADDLPSQKFRDRWHRGCEYYCPPGTGKDCAANGNISKLPQRCFWETDFGMPLEEIEKGTLIPQAGFARGNFNYRFDEVGVNLVGTGVKDCSSSTTPSACYGGSFLQYSLNQSGPYRVRTYDGTAVNAPLFPGQIQQAKALLAERYLTNPLSSADRNLMSDYWRSELRGRPMDGAFKLRIYDADGLDWNRLEDVQLVMHYRYWTRLN